MAAAMALMESLAIIFAILMANLYRTQEARQAHQGFLFVLKESFTEGAQILLLGTMVIGMITGASGKIIIAPFTGMIFKSMLAFFLLDMGVATAKRLSDLLYVPKRLAFYGVLAPIARTSIALMLAAIGGLSAANATLWPSLRTLPPISQSLRCLSMRYPNPIQACTLDYHSVSHSHSTLWRVSLCTTGLRVG